MQQKLCYIVSLVEKSLAFEWTSVRLKDKYNLTFILLNSGTSPLEEFLIKEGVRVERVHYESKRNFFDALRSTFKLLKSIRPDIVHCHLLDAQLIGLSASWLSGVKKRVYTRHNSNYHHAYARSGIKYDRWSNRLATHIISISQATDYTLHVLEGVRERKIRKIHHGFDLDQFTDVSASRILLVRNSWSIPSNRIVVGVIARQIEWKGIQYIIPAFARFNMQVPNSVLVLANAVGPYRDTLEGLIRKHNLDSVVRILFEEDVAALYGTFNMYVHAPVDRVCEAFGQTYVESLAMHVPSVFTLSGIAADFISHERNALVVPFKNSEAIFDAMVRLLNDVELKERLQKSGRDDVYSRFGISKMIQALEDLYNE
jgi:glycosyltransferase involved in cell wall biosynthesis